MAELSYLTRPIIGIENRTPQEVFDIMCDRLARSNPPSEVGPLLRVGFVDRLFEPTRISFTEQPGAEMPVFVPADPSVVLPSQSEVSEDMITRACEEAGWVVEDGTTDPVEAARITQSYRGGMHDILLAALATGKE